MWLGVAVGLALGAALGWWWRGGLLAPTIGPGPGVAGPGRDHASASPGGPRVAQKHPDRPDAKMPPPVSAPRVALVIDDLGRRPADLDEIAALGVPVAHALLPFERRTGEMVELARARGAEIVLHLPMESTQPGEDPGPGALRSGMSSEELRAAVERALAAVPGATGLNNHMGSALTTDAQAMRVVLRVAAEHRLFFLDSRTTPASVASEIARECGVAALARQVFLDDDPAPEAIRAQFARLLELATERGEAIAIGHPHPATFAVLAAEVPRARRRGVRFVSLRALLTGAAS